MKRIIFLSFFLILYKTTFSQDQKAEMFFHDGKSIEGYAEIVEKYDIKFRVVLDQDPDIWTNLMVKSIIIDEYDVPTKYEYISLQPGLKPKLLKVLTEGTINLYVDIKITKTLIRNINHNAHVLSNENEAITIEIDNTKFYGNRLPVRGTIIENEKSKYYVKRNTEKYPTPLFGVLGGGFRKKARKYFSDCKEVIERLDSREFDTHNSSEMVNFYNYFCVD